MKEPPVTEKQAADAMARLLQAIGLAHELGITGWKFNHQAFHLVYMAGRNDLVAKMCTELWFDLTGRIRKNVGQIGKDV